MNQGKAKMGVLALCRKTAFVTAALMMGLLVLGGVQDAMATRNPATCTDTGPALLIRILDPNGVAVSQGTAFYEGTSISYVARLIYDELPQCAYEGGSLCIETPEGSACTNVTPGGGIPLLCDDAINCNPLGVGQVLSNPKPYVVNRADIDPPPSDCPDLNSVRTRARYQNGSSYGDPDPNEVVFPINADTPACIVALFCGDGIVTDPPEECDDGNMINTDGCRNDCTLPFCGDGILDPNEACDDGNTNNNDSCRNDCTVPFCGDEILDPNETCDPPGSPAGGNGNLCDETCHVCGDGVVDTNEECDDGNGNDMDSCRNNCTIRECGDGIVEPPETCDPPGSPAGANNNTCRANCTVCGDGVEDPGEECDDGNSNDSDSCRNNCTEPRCGDEIIDPPETCDPPGEPAGENGNLCREDCTVCGDGEVNGDEQCDDGNGVDDDMCPNNCELPEVPGSCRMTGGHNYDVIDAGFNENGKVYTTGGQIGAPNESGCCDFPPKGKCVEGTCTGGLNGGLACSDNEQCPNDPGRNSHCPWGDWEHNHHSGSDDTNSVTSGSFAFHSGTAAAPDEAFIMSVQCADPGWCVQARPAPFKQIYWEGTGVFHNIKEKGKEIPLPFFGACGADQPKAFSQKDKGTIHYYRAHVSDFGEPAGIYQKPIDGCLKAESCTDREPNGAVEIDSCALGNVCLVDAENDPVKTALHPLCLAQQCSDCPDEYEIEIHCTADPTSPIAYLVSHEIREGNFQLHPPVGDSCNFSCGDGVCETGFYGEEETCATCPEDCCD